LPLPNAAAMGQAILIQVADTTIRTVPHTGIVVRNGHRAEIAIPLIRAVAQRHSLDDMTGSSVLTDHQSAGIPDGHLGAFAKVRRTRGLAQI